MQAKISAPAYEKSDVVETMLSSTNKFFVQYLLEKLPQRPLNMSSEFFLGSHISYHSGLQKFA
jgi:hypothetical protein